MATPTVFNSDMLRDMMKAVEGFGPAQTLLVSRGMRAQMEVERRAAAPFATPDNTIYAGYTQSYAGFPVETIDIPPEQVFDWSGCRSPSRAKRRHARGIPQRVKVTHRERAFLIDKRALTDWSNRYDRMTMKMLLGE